MVQRPPITPDHFFSNPAAREAGFTEQFWYQAYQLFLDEANRDPSPVAGEVFSSSAPFECPSSKTLLTCSSVFNRSRASTAHCASPYFPPATTGSTSSEPVVLL